MEKVKNFYYLRAKFFITMLSTLLFISSGEIFIILLFILIFFGADKIPEFTRMMGKGVREFRKATDDIKREFNDSSSGVLNDLKSISSDLSDSLTKEIVEPVKNTANEATKTFEEIQDYGSDYYYDNPYSSSDYGNEYQNESQASSETSIAQDNTDEAANEQTSPPSINEANPET